MSSRTASPAVAFRRASSYGSRVVARIRKGQFRARASCGLVTALPCSFCLRAEAAFTLGRDVAELMHRNDRADNCHVPRYTSEIELKRALGIESFRNLSKDTLLRFLEQLPEVDPELAIELIKQVPEIRVLATSVLDDAARAHEAALGSNSSSQEMVHEIHLKTLEILEAELKKDLSPEDWQRVLEEIRIVASNAMLRDTENKRYLAELLDMRLTAAVVASAAAVVGVIVVVATKSGLKPLFGAGRLLASSRNVTSVLTSPGS